MSENELREAVRQAKREYYRDYRARNKEKVKVYNSRYWEKRAAAANQNAKNAASHVEQ